MSYNGKRRNIVEKAFQTRHRVGIVYGRGNSNVHGV